MGQINDIKKRMNAVGGIQRITRTMQLIATTKFTQAVGRLQATRPFSEKVGQLVSEVAAAAGDVDHPLIRGADKPEERELFLVISSNRGLCGAFNANVLRASFKAAREIESRGRALTVEVSGKKAAAFLEFQGIAVHEQHIFGDTIKYEDVEPMADRFMKGFIAGEYESVKVAYMKYVSNARQVAEVMQLLPLQPPSTEDAGTPEAAAVYDFSPSSTELLDALLPLSVKTRLFQAFTDAMVSEQIMRMIAMKAATENAGELGKTLRRMFNRARQTQITTELMEIISGAAALE